MLRAFPRLLFGLLLLGCTEEAEEVQLRSMQASTEMTFICRDRLRQGLPRSQCPDLDHVPAENGMVALVTQTATDEVAVVNIFYATVEDQDYSLPGFSFLRMPSRPGDIVSTPGGVASFVGLTGVGKTGISAIPSACIGAAYGDKYAHDVTSLPACSLPSTPGDMVVLVEAPTAEGTRTSCDPSSPLESESPRPPAAFEYEVTCAGSGGGGEGGAGGASDASGESTFLVEGDPADPNPQLCKTYTCPDGSPPTACNRVRNCSADLTTEGGPSGRRKLAVALPDEGRIVVIDAQSVLDRTLGTFQPCVIEASIPLESEPDPAGQEQPDPEGLHPEGCELSRPPAPPSPPSFSARPAGMAAAEGKLYVADEGIPRVHVLDVTSVCGMRELPPLLPMAFDDPTRNVTTSRVAVSPLTPSGKRFVYAIDPEDRPTASMMAFDVSDGSTDRTPVMRSGSIRTPGEQPDRIQFWAPINDVTFALRDLPEEDPATGVAPGGLYCDPDPDLPADDPQALYRPKNDFTQGARPELLRGLFGFAMLTSGEVVVVDVDDFDAPCRRPKFTNPEETADFRGCANDTYFPPDNYYLEEPNEEQHPTELESDGRATVSEEVSCNVVEPHRTRSAVPGAVTSASGVAAPSLRAQPQFAVPDRSVQRTPGELPKLLAVNFPSANPERQPDGVPAEVYIGGALYRSEGASDDDSSAISLETDPNGADQSTLALPLYEPRSYTNETNVLVYEGEFAQAPNGFLDFSESVPGDPATIVGYLDDTAIQYCDRGVYDEAAMKDFGSSVLGVPSEDIDKFGESHADYVQITGDFPDAYDPYWVEYGNLACGGRRGCLAEFGSSDTQELDPRRDLRIIDAYQDHLKVKPRVLDRLLESGLDADRRQAIIDEAGAISQALDCCFPQGVRYRIRASNQWVLRGSASNFRHDVVGRPGPDPDGPGRRGNYRCERDCDPRRAYNRSRAFEITSSVGCIEEDEDGVLREVCSVGRQRSSWLDACSYDPGRIGTEDTESTSTGVKLSEPAAACVVENLTARFAVYRGLGESTRDMEFRWETTGQFIPMSLNMRVRSASVLPQRVEYVPELQSLFVTDAASLGLSLAPLDTLRIDDPWPVY